MTPEEETQKFALNVFVIWIPVMFGAIVFLSITAFFVIRCLVWTRHDRPFWPECFSSIFYYAPWTVIQRRRERRLARHLENVRRDDLESARTVSILRDIGMSEARRLRHSPSVIIVPRQLSDFSRLVPEITPPQRAAVVMPESKWFDDRTAKREKLLRSAERDQYKAFKGQQKKSSSR